MRYYVVTYRKEEHSPWIAVFRESQEGARVAADTLGRECYEVRMFEGKLLARWGPADTQLMPIA